MALTELVRECLKRVLVDVVQHEGHKVLIVANPKPRVMVDRSRAKVISDAFQCKPVSVMIKPATEAQPVASIASTFQVTGDELRKLFAAANCQPLFTFEMLGGQTDIDGINTPVIDLTTGATEAYVFPLARSRSMDRKLLDEELEAFLSIAILRAD